LKHYLLVVVIAIVRLRLVHYSTRYAPLFFLRLRRHWRLPRLMFAASIIFDIFHITSDAMRCATLMPAVFDDDTPFTFCFICAP